MNPFEEYIAIIHSRQQEPLIKGQYGEKHHIIPKSCGGSNAKWNLVKLTPEEHYRCHYLLTFIYPDGDYHNKMVYAWWMMKRVQDSAIEISAEEYGRLRREYARVNSQTHKGFHSPCKGVPLSEEHKRKLSEAKKGKPGPTKGKTTSEETKRKISLAMKGKKHKKYVHTEAFWEKQRRKRRVA